MNHGAAIDDLAPDENQHVTLCEALDRVLNKGAVVVGEITISVANVDLIYLGLQVVLTSIDTARGMKGFAGVMGTASPLQEGTGS